MDLRPYQVAAIAGARERIRAGAKRCLLICPTGGGKTVIASEIIRSAVAKQSRVLFLAHRRELIQQTSDKLLRFGVHHGIIAGDFREALHRPVQVASVQALIRRPGRLSAVDLVFVDEAHHLTAANTYAKLLEWYPTARVVGLTATPWRLDGQGLGDVFDAHVLACSPRELRDLGFLCSVGGFEYEAIDTSSARVQRGDFVAGDLQAAATNRRVVGDAVSEWLLYAAGKRTVLFAVSVLHSQLMVQEFQRAGVPAEHIDGEMAIAERDAVLERLRRGETLVVSNCNVLTEGFDCPELEVAVLCRPTLSTSLALQMIGRILRPAEGKALARIHDHAGILAAHGHPYAERDFSPTMSSKASRKDLEKPEAKQRRCPSCKSVLARWPCDACGYSPNPRELKLEYEEAARKREISENGRGKAKAQESDAERRERWEKKFAHDVAWKRTFLQRMIDKHGKDKGARVYYWFSGKSERPPRAWIDELLGEAFA